MRLMFLSGVCESNGWSSLLASWASCVLLGRKGYHCVGERSVTCLICVCVSVWVHFCALQVKWEDSMTVSRVKHFQGFVFMLSSPSLTHPPALSHVLLFFGFVSSLSSPVSLSRHITLAFFSFTCHFLILLYLLFASLSNPPCLSSR